MSDQQRDAEPVRGSSAPATGSTPSTGSSVPATSGNTLRHDVVAREKEEFGGFKFGSAFFGWLTATGMAVLLTALLSAIGAGVGLGVSGDVESASEDAAANAT